MDLTDALTFARPAIRGSWPPSGPTGGRSSPTSPTSPTRATPSSSPITDDRAKTANLRRDPRASLYVLGDNFYQYVVIEAAAELSPVAADPHDATVEALIRYYEAASGRTRTGTSTAPP